eukprot:2223817-Prymnesium_polylepis.1
MSMSRPVVATSSGTTAPRRKACVCVCGRRRRRHGRALRSDHALSLTPTPVSYTHLRAHETLMNL